MLEINELSIYEGSTTSIYGKRLANAEFVISAIVTEVANSFATLEIKCAISESNLRNLSVGNMIRCYKDILMDGLYTFEIYDVTYSMDHIITVKAEHVMARLRNVFVKPTNSFVETPQISILNILMGETDYKGNYYLINKTGKLPFTISKDLYSSIRNCHPSFEIKSVADYMVGSTGSFVRVSGVIGQWVYINDTEMRFMSYDNIDNKSIWDTLPSIIYGSNMSSFKRTIDLDAAKHAQILFWKGKESETSTEETLVYAVKNKSGTETYFLSNAQLIDCSSEFDTIPTEEQLLAEGGTFTTTPEVTTDVDVAGYDGMCTVGDKINVLFSELGIGEQMRVSETTYNCLTNKYDKIKIGTLKKTLSKTIAEVVSKTNVGVY